MANRWGNNGNSERLFSWTPKNWCFWTVVLEKTLESLLDCKEIKPVNPKGNQPWIFIGRTDVEAETPIRWSLDAKSWLIEKYPDARKDWRQEEKGSTEDEMVGWHHWLNRHEFKQALGEGEGGNPGVLQSMGSRRVRCDLGTEQQTLMVFYIPPMPLDHILFGCRR